MHELYLLVFFCERIGNVDQRLKDESSLSGKFVPEYTIKTFPSAHCTS